MQIIDELVLRLGLDAKKFNEEQRQAVAEAKKANDELLKAGKRQEEGAKSIGEAFAAAEKHALEFFGVVLGGRGLKELVAQLTTTDAALGRLGQNLAISPQILSSWQLLSERVGGSAEATTGSLQRINEQLYNLHRNGQMLPTEFSQLQAITGIRIDPDHGLDKYLQDISKAAYDLGQHDRNRAFMLLQGLGIDEGTANAMLKFGGAFEKYLKDVNQYAPSDNTISRMQELQTSWVTLQQSAIALANTIWTDLEPVLKPIIAELTTWIDQSRDIIGHDFAAGVQQFVSYLKGVDWPSVASNLATIANSILSIMGVAAQFGLGGGGGSKTPAEMGSSYNNDFYTHQDQGQPGPGFFNMGSDTPGMSYVKNDKANVGLVRAFAQMYGIDPDVAVKVFSAEGRANPLGDDGSSFGGFQLHYGGISKQFPNAGLGDQFTKETGLFAGDLDTNPDQLAWVMKYVAQHGWDSWMGAKAAGITGFQGVSPNAAAISARSAAGMARWAHLSSVQNNYPTTTSQQSVAIHGLTIQTQAHDADQMVRDAAPALRRRLKLWAAQTGPA